MSITSRRDGAHGGQVVQPRLDALLQARLRHAHARVAGNAQLAAAIRLLKIQDSILLFPFVPF